MVTNDATKTNTKVVAKKGGAVERKVVIEKQEASTFSMLKKAKKKTRAIIKMRAQCLKMRD